MIDRERTPEIILEVMAIDRGVPALATSVYVKVVVNDVNDNGPVFLPIFYNAVISIDDALGENIYN